MPGVRTRGRRPRRVYAPARAAPHRRAHDELFESDNPQSPEVDSVLHHVRAEAGTDDDAGTMVVSVTADVDKVSLAGDEAVDAAPRSEEAALGSVEVTTKKTAAPARTITTTVVSAAGAGADDSARADTEATALPRPKPVPYLPAHCDACPDCGDYCLLPSCVACKDVRCEVEADLAAGKSRKLTMCHVERNDGRRSTRLWLAAHGRVYDVTSFVKEHPGGPNSILKHGGCECSEDFDFHSDSARRMWRDYEIGKVVRCGSEPGGGCVVC